MSSSSPVLAGPPGDCCVQGVKHSGTPTGKTIEIAGVPTYISEPSVKPTGPTKVLLFLADVWGPFFLNNQLLQNYFAEQGYVVLGLDYFFGDPVYPHNDEPGFDRNAWFAKSRKNAEEALPKWLDAVRKQYGTGTKYFPVGYCFGAPYALDLATSDKVEAAAFAHPAGLNESHFTSIKKPLLLSCAEVDHTFPLASRRRAEDLLVEAKASYHIQVFSGVAHGFTARGNMDNENERWAKEESARSVIRWFNRFSQ